MWSGPKEREARVTVLKIETKHPNPSNSLSASRLHWNRHHCVPTLLLYKVSSHEALSKHKKPIKMRLLVAEVAPPLSSAATPTCNSHSCRWEPYSNSSDFTANASVLLILLFSALICALSLYAAIRCFLRPTLETNDDNKPDPEAAASSAAPTPTLVYTSDLELAGAEAECAICLSEFEQGESIQVLEKCQHGFHVKCIHKWLSTRSSCPTCRTSIFSQHSETPSSQINA